MKIGAFVGEILANNTGFLTLIFNVFFIFPQLYLQVVLLPSPAEHSKLKKNEFEI